MNRQEAIDFIHQTAQHLERLGEHNPAKALEIALETILPTPDSDTGLMPCGCGGKAGFHYSVMMRDNDCYVECGICGGHTKVVLSEDKARDAWNTAMGWKGGAE